MKKIAFISLLCCLTIGLAHAAQEPRPLPLHVQKMNPATRLGWMYYRGIGTKRNYKKAYHWFEQGAVAGDTQALFFRAAMLEQGRGVKKDEKRAFALFYDLADKYATAPAAFKLSLAYEKGIGCEPNEAQSNYWLDFAAKNGVPPAQLKKGLALLEKQPKQGAALVKQAAENPHFRWAQYQLALLYANGIGVKKDIPQALNLMQQTAQRGLPKAQWQLAQWYEQGINGTPDTKQAFDWTLKAAQNGVLEAQYRISQMYRDGYGTPVNLKEAKRWEKKAAKTAKKPTRNEEFY